MVAGDGFRVVAGQELKVTSPGRVLYPETGTTKSQVLDYYERVAPFLLPHLHGRPATRKRWPDGVDGPAFFAKDLELGTPGWMARVQIRHGSGPKFYPVFDTPASLVWLGQVSALELHVPQWQIGTGTGPQQVTATSSVRHPDRVVFDLDPGPGAGLPECVEIAVLLRERLGPLGERVIPVTSGSKGLHLYVPMDHQITSRDATEWARLAAEQIERTLPGLAVSRMTKSIRAGKVLIDWSQNNAKKTTISPYSLRGRTFPTVAAPRTWAELTEPGLRHLTFQEVLERLKDGLDPLADLLADPPVVLAHAVGAPAPPAPRPSLTLTNNRPRTATAQPHLMSPPADRASLTLPAGLAGPVEVELAKAEETVPGPHAMPGGSWFELKWDGYRLAAVHGPRGIRLWSRHGTDLTDRFPEIATAAATVVPVGTVLDGEVVIWNGDRLDFDRLQRRLAGGAARIAQQVRAHPASYIVFDVLALNGDDQRNRPLRERRATLEDLAAAWTPPLQVSPLTDDITTAQAWLTDYRHAGIEGLVVKGAGTRYEPGQRRWIKVKARESIELIVGAVIGPIDRPESIVAGLYRDGVLVIAGRSVPLTTAQSRSLATVLNPALADHPWPDTVASNRFGGGRDRVQLTKVDPTVVAEVTADSALQGGVWRHPLRFIRFRPDLTPDDLPQLA